MKGALVALPCPSALDRLGRLRSPAWALVGPASLLVGTFGVLAAPQLATGLALLAALATPALAAIAVVAVVHRRGRGLLLVPVALGLIAAAGSGWTRQLAASLLTALACLTLGAAFARLTPVRSLQLGVLGMGALDVLLLAVGIGQPAADLLREASASVPLAFHRAELGTMATDFPDLVLAAALGGVVAGRAMQRPAAVIVTILAVAYGALFAVADMLPATVPLVLVLVLVEWGPGARARARRPRRECAACRPRRPGLRARAVRPAPAVG